MPASGPQNNVHLLPKEQDEKEGENALFCTRYRAHGPERRKFAPQERDQKRTVEQVVNVCVEVQSQFALIQEAQGTMEVRQGQYIDRIVDVTVCCNTKYDPSEQCTSRQHRRRRRLFQRQSSMIQKDGRDPSSVVH